RGAGHAHPLADLAFAHDLVRDAPDFRRFRLLELDHVVEGLGNLAVDAGQVERHAHGEVAALERAQRSEELAAVEHHVKPWLDRFHSNSSEEKGKSSGIVGAIPTAGYPNRLLDSVVISTTARNQKKSGSDPDSSAENCLVHQVVGDRVVHQLGV